MTNFPVVNKLLNSLRRHPTAFLEREMTKETAFLYINFIQCMYNFLYVCKTSYCEQALIYEKTDASRRKKKILSLGNSFAENKIDDEIQKFVYDWSHLYL